MREPILSNHEIAVREFQRARREAAVQQVLARLRGESDALLRYDEVRQQLRAGRSVKLGLQEIPLDKIVGSVGRHGDFTRGFMPKLDSDEERWVRIRAAVTDMKAMLPIEVYQVGDAYFVQDGNHRVSVAQQLGAKTISAQVSKVETRVALTADDDPEQVICKARFADFLERTNIDKLYPEADLITTTCGQYRMLLDQIEIECRLLGDNGKGECKEENWEAAVVKWYQDVYLPIVQIVRELGLMRRFPKETETDIYLLLSERREALEEASGWRIDYETALPELVQKPNRPIFKRVLGAVAPGLEKGPATGLWRERRLALHREEHLFERMIVLLEGIEGDWPLLDQLIRVAQHDKDHILGLHVVRDQSAVDQEAIQRLRYGFELRCHAAGLRGEFAVEYGNSYRIIARRGAWADIVVTNLTDPPEANPLARIRPGWVGMMNQCPCPILAFPNSVQSDLDRAMLAYDGSAEADEALYIATYSTLRWQRALTVLTVKTARTGEAALERARDHLERHGVTWADYVLADGAIHDAILQTAKARDVNLLIMGGIGRRPLHRRLSGSTVEQILREFKQPMWICR